MAELVPSQSAPVTFVASRMYLTVILLVLLAAALLLIVVGHADDDRRLLYFLGYPSLVVAVAGLVFLLLRPPMQIVIGSDWVAINGKRSPASEIVVGDPRLEHRGDRMVQLFSLTTMAADGRMTEVEFHAGAWPQFAQMHRLLSSLAARGKPST